MVFHRALKKDSKKISIMLVDPCNASKVGLQNFFYEKRDQFSLIFTAKSCREAVKLLKKNNHLVDILITELYLHNNGGSQLIHFVKKNCNHIKCIGYSNYCNNSIINKALEMGMDCFVKKDSSLKDLSKEILKCYREIDNSIKKAESQKGDNNSNILTDREKQVMYLICSNNEYKSHEVGQVLDIATNTVYKHRQNIKKKIKSKGDVGMTKFAIQQGLIDSKKDKKDSEDS
ncbi:MAG: response regulator transcription factor [Spirochaetia bacterium]|nr:response regulator transcription factor [Spirochaetia bacterium]MCF7946737.1 response regulator transcription factor [Spirochaetia bacterium]MCF7952450.1 response regulator transcription factor [Spirochaetales bacterium]